MDDSAPSRHSLLSAETLGRLVRLLQASDVDEIEIVRGDTRVYVRRERERNEAVTPSTVPHLGTEGVAITAPLTGVYYPRPSPEEPLFVQPGSSVEPGQVVALIETMKLFNEVLAEVAGEVLSIAVQLGDLVEAGQPLIYIRPREQGEQP